jgi:hypothetical protein
MISDEIEKNIVEDVDLELEEMYREVFGDE